MGLASINHPTYMHTYVPPSREGPLRCRTCRPADTRPSVCMYVYMYIYVCICVLNRKSGRVGG